MSEFYEGYGELAFKFRLTGDPGVMVTTMGYTSISDKSRDSLYDAGYAVESSFKNKFCDAPGDFYAGWTYEGASLRFNPVASLEETWEIPRSIEGTVVGETPPQNVAILIKKVSNLAGRANRGRMYLPPFTTLESAITKNGMLASGDVTAITGKAQDWLEEGPAADYFLVINHAGGLVEPTIIGTLICESQVATQRRRLR